MVARGFICLMLGVLVGMVKVIVSPKKIKKDQNSEQVVWGYWPMG